MAIHDGHRNRMRQRIEKDGIESLQEHEILEYLLYAVVPRKDTNELAHKIIEICGNLNGVFDQSIERLQKIEGVTYNMAIFLSSMSGIIRRYLLLEESGINISNVQECVKIMRPIFETLKYEEMHMLLGNSKGKYLKRVLVAKGNASEVHCNVRDLVDIALRNNASRVVIIHNHPSNRPQASFADDLLTEKIFMAFNMIGIKFQDHIIVTKDSYFSYSENGVLTDMSNGLVTFQQGTVGRLQYVPTPKQQFDFSDY